MLKCFGTVTILLLHSLIEQATYSVCIWRLKISKEEVKWLKIRHKAKTKVRMTFSAVEMQ